jgi:hypothetical protein
MPDEPFPAIFVRPKVEPKKTPVACLVKTYDSLCRRTIEADKEFAFRDHEWAFAYYDGPGSPIRICSACKEIYLKAKGGTGM